MGTLVYFPDEEADRESRRKLPDVEQVKLHTEALTYIFFINKHLESRTGVRT